MRQIVIACDRCRKKALVANKWYETDETVLNEGWVIETKGTKVKDYCPDCKEKVKS